MGFPWNLQEFNGICILEEILRNITGLFVMILPDIIKVPAVQLIGEKCYSTLVEDFDITDVACLKILLSKGLGFGIVLGGRSKDLYLTGITIVAISYVLGSSSIINDAFLSYLQALTIPFSISSKIPQIIINHKNSSTGQLSSFAVFGFTAGSLARIFTTLSEVDDSLLLSGYILGSIFNIILTIQMINYWNTEKIEKISTEKED
ncbi:mannose-P-dolichol utilization defect 1 protein [Rhizophagus irregularis DAOM 181602=DAOM 197198]|nr:mannose-P-dolichol utilization defect 1 protein [Rhizophagus irregularis DAOM 181602=DAOM 197198]